MKSRGHLITFSVLPELWMIYLYLCRWQYICPLTYLATQRSDFNVVKFIHSNLDRSQENVNNGGGLFVIHGLNIVNVIIQT